MRLEKQNIEVQIINKKNYGPNLRITFFFFSWNKQDNGFRLSLEKRDFIGNASLRND